MDLTGQVVIVTGGCGLLGKEIVRSIIGAGGIAVIADMDNKQGVEIQKEIQSTLWRRAVGFVKLDITSKRSIQDSITDVVNTFGKITGLVNCAYPRNKNYGRKFFDVQYKDFCENIDMHLGGYFLASQQFAAFFKEQGGGNIINIASIYGVIPPRFEIYEGTEMTMPVEYAAIKSALIHLTKYMAKYLKGTNIRVNAVSPGGIFDGQPRPFLDAYKGLSLNKGMMDKGDLIGVVLFLLSENSKYINGQNIIVDDGFSL